MGGRRAIELALQFRSARQSRPESVQLAPARPASAPVGRAHVALGADAVATQRQVHVQALDAQAGQRIIGRAGPGRGRPGGRGRRRRPRRRGVVAAGNSTRALSAPASGCLFQREPSWMRRSTAASRNWLRFSSSAPRSALRLSTACGMSCPATVPGPAAQRPPCPRCGRALAVRRGLEVELRVSVTRPAGAPGAAAQHQGVRRQIGQHVQRQPGAGAFQLGLQAVERPAASALSSTRQAGSGGRRKRWPARRRARMPASRPLPCRPFAPGRLAACRMPCRPCPSCPRHPAAPRPSGRSRHCQRWRAGARPGTGESGPAPRAATSSRRLNGHGSASARNSASPLSSACPISWPTRRLAMPAARCPARPRRWRPGRRATRAGPRRSAADGIRPA